MPDVNGIVKYDQQMYAGVVLTEGGAVWYWPVTSSDKTVTEMPYGVFEGDWFYMDDGDLVEGFTASPVTDVAASGHSISYMHRCAVLEYKNMECWGSNSHGQLGDGTTTNSLTQPVRVQGLPEGNIAAMSLGYLFSCAILDGRDAGGYMNSTAWCWGYQQYGRLGNAVSSTTVEPTPQKVQGLQGNGNVTAISLGMVDHACALLDGGDVKCWGRNHVGQLGDGTKTNRARAVKVLGLERVQVAQIAVGYYFALALTTTGRVYAWGENGNYQLGDYTTNDRTTAVLVEVIPEQYTVTSISAGYEHACVSTLDGAFMCFGDGTYGSFGNGVSTAASSTLYTIPGYDGTYLPTPSPTPLPTPVPTTNRTRYASGVPYAGYYNTHIVSDDGGLWCVLARRHHHHYQQQHHETTTTTTNNKQQHATPRYPLNENLRRHRRDG